MTTNTKSQPYLTAKRSLLLTLTALGSGGVAVGKEQQPQQVAVDGNDTCSKPPSSSSSNNVQCQRQGIVPCVTYTDDPSQPDWGCTDNEPLCVVSNDPPANTNTPRIGSHCESYPCRKTSQSIELKIDEGCTQERPRCVDALQQDVLPEAFGMECIADPEIDSDASTTTTMASNTKLGLWGLLAQNKAVFGVAHQQQQHRDDSEFQVGSLCNGCPLSGQGRTCESSKSCDTLGGVHTVSSTTHPASAKTKNLYSW